MSELASTQIPKPRDEQAFERCNEVLWRCILEDGTVKLHGRRGQKQHGVDLTGIRGGQPDRIVGVQCKLKSDGKFLKEGEVRKEVEKALTFTPPLSEYIIVTTAPDDARLDSLAHELSISASGDREKNITIRIFGWGTLEREIERYPEALSAFDWFHTPISNRMEVRLDDLPGETAAEVAAVLAPKLHAILTAVGQPRTIDPASGAVGVHSEQERQINDCVDLMSTDPSGALAMLRKLEQRLANDTPDRIRFRVVANIAACQLELGKEDIAAEGFIDAWELAPDDPKAIANKAFGLLLKEDWPVLMAFAMEQLPKHPDNAALAGCYIHGLIIDETVTDPLAQVSDQVRGTAEVAEARVRWLMNRDAPGAWWDPAIAAHAAHPDNKGLREICANALLDRVLGGSAFHQGMMLNNAELADVHTAINIYEALWLEIRDGARHGRGDQTSVPLNLMIARRLLGEDEKAVEAGTEALERFPDDPTVKEYLAVMLAEQSKTDRALDLVSGLQPNPRTIAMRFSIAAAREEWDAVRNLVDNYLDAFPETERDFVLAVRTRADVELASAQQRRSLMEAVPSRFQGDARASIVLAQAARVHGWDDLANAYFTAAGAALANGDGRFASRLSIAEEAMARHEPGIAADVLIGHLPLDRDGAELQLLAQALVNDYPIRDRAERFFEDLAPEVRSLPVFQKMQGALHFNRGTPQDAIKPFSVAFEQQPSTGNLMCLVRAYYAVDDKESIVALLHREGVDALSGSSLERIEFCHVLLDFGQGARALDLGYQVLIEGLDHANVVAKFFGLALKPSPNRPNDFDGVVAPGVWVRLTSNSMEAYQALVGETDNRPWGEKVDPENLFIAKALGLKVGAAFEHVTAVTGATQTWTIAEVKPCWLQALHHLTGTFSQMFPDTPGFAAVPMTEGDVEPALEFVRRHSEGARERADLYLVNNLPIAFIAGGELGGSIAFAGYLVSIGEEVRVCHGTEEERSTALAQIDDNSRSGAVLDAFTAWHAAALDILPVLEERLGPLAVPASELQRLKAMIEDHEAMAGEETMSLAYEDAQYVRQIITGEEHAEYSAQIRSRVMTIEEACVVEPMVIPDDLSELGEAMIRSPSGDTAAPAILAGRGRLLLSEDMMMRRLASEVFGVKGVWVQAVLLSAVQARSMAVDAYADALVHLAAHRHGYVALNISVLLSTFERDSGERNNPNFRLWLSVLKKSFEGLGRP